jgi:Domain of unknown function (DUF1772)
LLLQSDVVTQSLRFLSLVCTALILGGAFCHVLEMPIKLGLSGADYMIVQQIYGTFGPVGSILEPAAIISTAALAFVVRGRRSFGPAVVAAVTLVVALIAWVAVVNPVNPHWAAAGPTTVPPEFEALRRRWEWGHATHAALLFVAFVATVVSVLVELPTRALAADARRARAERVA